MNTNYTKALRTNVYGNNPNCVQITYQKDGNMIFCIGSETIEEIPYCYGDVYLVPN